MSRVHLVNPSSQSFGVAELRPIYDGGRVVTARSVSQLYRQMYANTGIATDSARMQRSARWA